MRRMVHKAIGSVLLLTVMMIGCAKAGSEFVGKWVDTNNPMDTIDITRNGDQFQIVGPDQEKMDATYAKDGSLQIAGAMGMNLSLTYVKNADTLQTSGVLGATTYKRVK